MAAVLNPPEPIESSTTDTTDPVQYTRLHVTPLDESLLSIIVPSSVLPRARNISYHTIKAFPEKQYGFVDLPLADADKIKKRLNGAVLRGTKMRIEKAKPETIPQPTGDDVGATDTKKEKKKSKKRKREADVTPGIELEGRKVKRGWTTSEREMIEDKRKKSRKEKKSKDDKDKKKRKHVKSKYTDGPECLFKTKLPDAGSPSKNTDDAAGHKKKRKSSREVVMHEFEKTMKHPSFLKSTAEKSSSKAVTFEDGVGWVDENGTVVEPVVSERPRGHSSKSNSANSQVSKPAPVAEDDDTSSSGSSSDDSEDDEVSDEESNSSDEEKAETMAPPKKLKVETLALNSPTSNSKTESARPKSSSSVTSLTIKIPPATPATSSTATKVHPLEALYKRPKGDATTTSAPQEAQPFSFFDGDDEDIEEENTVGRSSQPPMTPFTKQDFEFRNLRSAAPTPDTAHPSSRTFNLWPRQNSVDEEDEDEEDSGVDQDGNDDEDTIMADTSNETTAVGGDKQTAVSDFQKQFWESRGDLNRSWRKRRKAASKEKRYRENRARAERAI
ncbi:hypothetical protein F4820DRAFT_419574 [Hypoxylon rubiginosum]|uniref:Uncharacterized protein n=1 Tax=Hypoxylon rubiginosum TaxID=110542 RepID=A0ACB9Z2M5_9PEZI|nr:hypothetical protein F4820DRAFT_419574 [Hypoxylon rubiginosum]